MASFTEMTFRRPIDLSTSLPAPSSSSYLPFPSSRSSYLPFPSSSRPSYLPLSCHSTNQSFTPRYPSHKGKMFDDCNYDCWVIKLHLLHYFSGGKCRQAADLCASNISPDCILKKIAVPMAMKVLGISETEARARIYHCGAYSEEDFNREYKSLATVTFDLDSYFKSETEARARINAHGAYSEERFSREYGKVFRFNLDTYFGFRIRCSFDESELFKGERAVSFVLPDTNRIVNILLSRAAAVVNTADVDG